MFYDTNAGRICETCGKAYQRAGFDEGVAYYGPICDCWLEMAFSDFAIRQNPEYYEEFEDFIDEFDYHDSMDILDSGEYVLYQDDEKTCASKNFARLKEKYRISFFPGTFLSSPLYNILLRIEAQHILSEAEIKWLEINGLFPVVAQAYLQKYQMVSNGWDLVKAAKYFRKADMPNKNIEITDNFITSNRQVQSAILTTRGAAFKDIGQLDNAENCAFGAINEFPTKYAYNFLGSIYFKRRQYDRAMGYFKTAEQYGATHADINTTIKNEINSIEKVEIKLMAEYLLAEDSIRFGWVTNYLV